MAISDEEQKLQDEARTAVLAVIKDNADKIKRGSQPHADAVRNLAEAYALVVGKGERKADAGRTF